METISLFLACMFPLAIFAAGWMSCYLLVVKYRVRIDHRAPEEIDQIPATGRRRGKEAAWEP